MEDVQRAADVFRPLYDRLQAPTASSAWRSTPTWPTTPRAPSPRPGGCGPGLARPNVFIKVPATRAGLPAIRQLISEGINVNVTLLFGLPRYREVAEAYIAGLEDRAAQGQPLNGWRRWPASS